MNFNKRTLESLPVPSQGRKIYHDDSRPGMVFKIEASGQKSWGWYRKVRGYPVYRTLGLFPEVSIELARQGADELNSAVAKWKSSDYEGPGPFVKIVSTTLDSVVERYIDEHLRHHAKNPERAAKGIRWQIKTYFPSLRQRKISDIQYEEVSRIHKSVGSKNGHRAANHAVQNLRTLYNFARRAKIFTGANPAADHVMFDEVERERFLSREELTKLWTALNDSSRDVQDFTNLALFTAARRSDILSMRWEDLVLEGEEPHWRVPLPKAKVPYTVPLLPEARGILLARLEKRKDANPWVFPSRGRTGHLTDLKKGWRDLLERAGLHVENSQRPRIHDLRRTAGAHSASSGQSLLVVGRMLGHQDPSSTKIYARIDTSAIRKALEAGFASMHAKPKPAALPPARKRRARRG